MHMTWHHHLHPHRLAGHPFNLGSPKQVGEVLYGQMGLESRRTTATGAQGTDASVLEELAAEGHALPRVLLDWRQLSKLKGTYTDALVAAIAPAVERLCWRVTAAARASSSRAMKAM